MQNAVWRNQKYPFKSTNRHQIRLSRRINWINIIVSTRMLYFVSNCASTHPYHIFLRISSHSMNEWVVNLFSLLFLLYFLLKEDFSDFMGSFKTYFTKVVDMRWKEILVKIIHICFLILLISIRLLIAFLYSLLFLQIQSKVSTYCHFGIINLCHLDLSYILL